MIENLAFSGGGVKGFSYAGVVQKLEEQGVLKNVKRISGTSIGSLTSLLICLGYSSSEMKNIVFNLDLRMLENIDINRLFSGYGLDDGSKMAFFIGRVISSKGYDKDITFSELYEKTGIHLFISCCDITTYEQKVFDYTRTPAYVVREACRFSMSIPLIWTLCEEKYIDGCFSRNLPIELLPVENTLGFSLSTGINSQKNLGNLQDYITSILKCSMAKGQSLELEKYKLLGYRVIQVVTGIGALQVNISFDEKMELIRCGYCVSF